MVREGRVLISPASDIDFGSGYLVTVCGVGAQVAAASASTTITVRSGHGFRAGYKLLVWPQTGISAISAITKYRIVNSVTATTVVVSESVSVAAGEFLVNLGADTGTAAPNYNGSTAPVYSDMDYVNLYSGSTLASDSVGRYRYHHKGIPRWEFVRTPTGTPYALYIDDAHVRAERIAADYATAGTGTSSSPYTGWSGAIAANTRTVFDANAYFAFNSDLSIPEGATLEGGGPSTVLLVTANDTAIVNATNAGNISIRNLKLDCQRNLYAVAPVRNGFEFTQGTGSNYLWENVHVTRANKAGIRMTGGAGVRTNAVVRGCTITNCGWHGVDFQELTTWSHVEGSYFEANNATTLGAQIYLSGETGANPTEACTIIGNRVIGSLDNGIRVMGNYAVVSNNIIIVGANDGIRLNGTHNACVGNIVVSPAGAGIKWDFLSYSTISGNSITSAGTHGIHGRVDFTGSTQVTFSGRNVITGNVIRASTIDAIRMTNVSAAETETIIANNACLTSQTSGIDLGGSLRGFAHGNLLRGNVASITDAGSANQCLNNIHELTGTYGPDVVSAATITLPPVGESFEISGTTPITSVTASWPGRKVTLVFLDALTFTHGSNLLLADNTSMTTSTSDTISLICDGTNWLETGRATTQGVKVAENVTTTPQNITVAGKYLIDLTNVSGTNTITLSAPSGTDGKILILRCAALTAGTITLADSGNVVLSAAWVPTASDTLTLIASGVLWYEIARADNT